MTRFIRVDFSHFPGEMCVAHIENNCHGFVLLITVLIIRFEFGRANLWDEPSIPSECAFVYVEMVSGIWMAG